MQITTSQQLFLELVKAGLWVNGNQDMPFNGVTDWDSVYQLAQEQSVQGVVLQGIEVLKANGIELSVPKGLLLKWIGEVQVIEQRNKEMNAYIADLIDKLRLADIYTLLVKGQGIAQCYEKPLWRSCGDVDLYLSLDNYRVAKKLLCAKASHIDVEDVDKLHLAMTIDGWVVELHGSMHSNISRRINKGLDEVHNNVFFGGEVRSWNNSGATVFLPSANNDVIIVFSHILQHFFDGGIGIRQVCDWCRLLWTYRDKIDENLLRNRLKSMGLLTEWKAFATLAVKYLGMPEESILLLDRSSKYERKASRILSLIFETGNFGKGRDVTYKQKNTFYVRLAISFSRHTKDAFKQFMVFPHKAIWVWLKMVVKGVRFAAKRDNKMVVSLKT